MRRETEVQHLGEDRARQYGAVSPAIVRTSLFAFPDTAALEAALHGGSGTYVYSRVSNPTVRVLEAKVASLEKAEDALALSSGMAAVSAVFFAFLRAGDHLVLSAKAYGPTLKLVRDVIEPFGVRVTRLDPAGFATLEAHLTDATRLVYLESPASLTFEVSDLEAASRAARARGVATVVDNSWATPLYQQPVALGIDLSLHSGTKYLGGHSDILLGLVAGGAAAVERVRRTAVLLGASLSPEDAFLAVRGLRTLPLRMERHRESALLLARRLMAHPRVKAVFHPAHPFFPTHALWLRQMSGSSGLFSFRLDGDTRRFCDALRVFLLGVSWGGFESLALPAAVLSEVVPERGVRPDVPQDLIRLSIGLEDPEDLWEDLERGFAALDAAR
jgi:cystathionine beta-lyase